MAEEGTKNDITFDFEFIKFYSTLQKRENVFQIFNHNTFYTLHNDNAEHVSKNFLNTTESLKTWEKGNEQITFTWISQTRFTSLIRYLLIENNFCVEIYNKNNPNKQWMLESEASPGCLGSFENILYEDEVNISIQLSSIYVTDDYMVYVTSIDPVGCIIYLGLFQDNDCLRQLESILVRTNPKECFIPETAKKLSHLLKRNNIFDRKYSPENQIDQEVSEILSDLSLPQYRHLVEDIFNQSCNRISIPLKPLLSKQKLLVARMKADVLESNQRNEYPFGCFFIQRLNPSKFVRLDLPSIVHLHLFPKTRDTKHSLFQLLNHCKTICGKKLLQMFIRQPSSDKNTIETRLNIVEFFIQNTNLATTIRDQILPQIPDITKLYKKLNTERYSIKDIFNLYILLEQFRHLKFLFDDTHFEYPIALKQKLIYKLTESIAETNQLYMKLAKSLDLNHYKETGDLCLNAKIFPDLAQIDNHMKTLTNQAKKDHKMIKLKYKTNILLEKDKDIGWFYRINKKSQIDLDNSYIIISKEKDLKFLTKLLKKINNEYCTAEKQFNKISQNCIKLLLSECRKDLFRISFLESFVSLLDVLLAFAKVACDSRLPYTKPTILSKGSDKIELIQFRHPMIEMIKYGEFVPNDVRFNDSCKFYIITGPNMGGKSTLLRSVALCVLMAQMGSFVPCQSATISLVDAIYSRISSNDDQSMGLSTFMVEMCEIAAILKSSTSDSLVLIDELGRSTSTNDGYGIAQSVTEYLSNKIHPYTLFATHFPNLGSELSNVFRLHMQSSFNGDQLIIHYTAQPESNKKDSKDCESFGIEMMKCIEMPKHLIKAAQNRLEKIYNSSIDTTTFDKALMINVDSNINNCEAFINEVNKLL